MARTESQTRTVHFFFFFFFFLGVIFFFIDSDTSFSKHRQSLQNQRRSKVVETRNIMFPVLFLRGTMRKNAIVSSLRLLLGDRAGRRKPTATERKKRHGCGRPSEPSISRHRLRPVRVVDAIAKVATVEDPVPVRTDIAPSALRPRCLAVATRRRSELAGHYREGNGPVCRERGHHIAQLFIWLSAPAATHVKSTPQPGPPPVMTTNLSPSDKEGPGHVSALPTCRSKARRVP